MPSTKRLLKEGGEFGGGRFGVTFTNHFVSTPICCPSRVNLLRGQYSHNTNFTDVLGPHGGYAKFKALRLDADWLPGWLQAAGYNTLYTGKFIVDYTIRNHDPPPAGWTAFDALVHPFTFEYYCPAFALDGGPPTMYPAQYVTDVVGAKARALLRSAAADAAATGRPFYLQVAPPAPHHSMHYDFNATGGLRARHWYPPVPADRHWEAFSGAALPRPDSFNPRSLWGKPAWVRGLARLTPGNVTFLEEVFRLRLRSLLAVDEMVEGLMSDLAALGLSNSTYVMFTSDNGYHEGAHRQGSGKTTAYDEDIRVPLLVAGPGLTPGAVISSTTQHIDLAPTILVLAGAPLPDILDGEPLPLAAAAAAAVAAGDAATGPAAAAAAAASEAASATATAGLAATAALPAGYDWGTPARGPPRNELLAEFWGVWDDESIHSHAPYLNHTWKAVRVLRRDRSEAYKYVLHCSGEYELYDLVRDPHETTNLLAPAVSSSSSSSSSSDEATAEPGHSITTAGAAGLPVAAASLVRLLSSSGGGAAAEAAAAAVAPASRAVRAAADAAAASAGQAWAAAQGALREGSRRSPALSRLVSVAASTFSSAVRATGAGGGGADDDAGAGDDDEEDGDSGSSGSAQQEGGHDSGGAGSDADDVGGSSSSSRTATQAAVTEMVAAWGRTAWAAGAASAATRAAASAAAASAARAAAASAATTAGAVRSLLEEAAAAAQRRGAAAWSAAAQHLATLGDSGGSDTAAAAGSAAGTAPAHSSAAACHSEQLLLLPDTTTAPRSGEAAAAAAAAAAAGAGATAGAAAASVSSVSVSAVSAYCWWLTRVRSRLDALLAVLAVCRGRACVRPFEVLHPDGAVSDLWAAMDEQYDSLYGGIGPFRFGRCLPYQDADNEQSDFRGATVGGGAAGVVGGGGSGGGGGGGGGAARSLQQQEGYAAVAQAAAAAAAGGGSGGGGKAVGALSAEASTAGSVARPQEGPVGPVGPEGQVAPVEQQEREGQQEGGPEGQQEEQQRPAAAVRLRSGFLYLRDEGVEAGAVPLPRKYRLVRDIYGLREQQYGGGATGAGAAAAGDAAAAAAGMGGVDAVRLGNAGSSEHLGEDVVGCCGRARARTTESNIICALWPRTDGLDTVRKAGLPSKPPLPPAAHSAGGGGDSSNSSSNATAPLDASPPPPEEERTRINMDDYDFVPRLVNAPPAPPGALDMSALGGDNCTAAFQPIMDYGEGAEDGSAGGWSQLPFVALTAVVQGLDPSTLTYNARVVIRLSEGFWKDLQYDTISLPEELVLRIIINNGEPQEYSDGDILGPGAPIIVENSPVRELVNYLSYPFDKYRLRLSLSIMMVNTSDNNCTSFVPFVSDIKTKSTMFQFTTLEDSLRLSLATTGSALIVDVDAVRNLNAKAFCLIIFSAMWLLTLVCAAHAFYVLFLARVRTVGLDPAAFAATLLFALPAVREVQPGVPPMGATIDVVGFFFNMTLLAIVCILLVGAALNDTLDKSDFAALDDREEDSPQQASDNRVRKAPPVSPSPPPSALATATLPPAAPPSPPPELHRLVKGSELGDDYDVVPLYIDPPPPPDNATDLSYITGDACVNLFQPVMDYGDESEGLGPWTDYPFLMMAAVIQGLDPSTLTYSARIVIRLSRGLWKDLQYDTISLPEELVLRIIINNGEPMEYSDGDILGPGATLVLHVAGPHVAAPPTGLVLPPPAAPQRLHRRALSRIRRRNSTT
ncbi:hypothetical protein HXX76_007206 [Chlamydomonas incerta]|uniref:Sulfatase N-terminal domain-containing protein n=1 Tax=Chlamydomonas incerta TaxID=51695 RepID=A0A835T0L2_CHLIN|nr:hypothetical protein HXX76_007206 [Chlamydomonas incerta]|eukprot:KAG2435121.1 hypothetical protein HXX76_007206 [Chlamydomonas incerta]